MIDGYSKPSKTIEGKDKISNQLVNYGIKQSNISFQIPIFTKDVIGNENDSKTIANHHLLVAGNFMSLTPKFNGINDHQLVKRGIGLVYIYNTGKKGVWYFDFSPFMTSDVTYKSKAYYRFASTAVYSYNFNNYFNIRGGFTKSFLWGNRLYLPFIGIRFGSLDNINISIQFPRIININIPVNNRLIFSIYTKPQGGMFNFSNHDTLYPNIKVNTFHFSRNEINTGLRMDLRFSRINIYTAIGFSTKNTITFFSEKSNTNKVGYYQTYFFDKNIKPTLYFNLGMLLKLGNTRSSYNNRNIYDAFDLNNVNGNQDNNAQIKISPKKISKNNNIESIGDLLDNSDF